MRRSKERRKQKNSNPPDKIFKYPVTCIKCGKGFLVAEEHLDLSNLRCDICSGKLRYRKGKWIRSKKKMKKGKETKVHPLLLHKMNKHKEASVKELLKQLVETKNPEEKKRLRRLLRRRGHRGGLKKRKTNAKGARNGKKKKKKRLEGRR